MRRFRTVGMLLVVVASGACASDSRPRVAASNAPPSVSASASPSAVTFRTDESVKASPPGATSVAFGNFRFTPSSVRVSGGSFALFLMNADPPDTYGCAVPRCTDHDLSIMDASRRSVAKSERLAPKESGLFVVEGLAAGRYEIRCTILAHAADFGMVGQLEVAA